MNRAGALDVGVCMHMCMYMHMCTPSFIVVRAACQCVCMWRNVCMCIHVCRGVCMHICICVHGDVHLCMSVCLHV